MYLYVLRDEIIKGSAVNVLDTLLWVEWGFCRYEDSWCLTVYRVALLLVWMRKKPSMVFIYLRGQNLAPPNLTFLLFFAFIFTILGFCVSKYFIHIQTCFSIDKSVLFDQSGYLLYWCVQGDYASVSDKSKVSVAWPPPKKKYVHSAYLTQGSRGIRSSETYRDPGLGGVVFYLNIFVYNSCGQREGMLIIIHWLLTSSTNWHHHPYPHCIGLSKSWGCEELQRGWEVQSVLTWVRNTGNISEATLMTTILSCAVWLGVSSYQSLVMRTNLLSHVQLWNWHFFPDVWGNEYCSWPNSKNFHLKIRHTVMSFCVAHFSHTGILSALWWSPS